MRTIKRSDKTFTDQYWLWKLTAFDTM